MKINISALAKHFCIPEIKLILGKKCRNFLTLLAIVTIALIGIGSAEGALKYLSKEMNSPYVKFVDVIIPYGHKDLNNYENDLRSQEVSSSYSLSRQFDVYFTWADFIDINGGKVNAKVRGVTEKDEFYQYLIGESDVLLTSKIKNHLFSRTDYGCIVTKEYLKKLGVNNISYINYFDFRRKKMVPIPICGIVPFLPEEADMLVSMELIAAIKTSNPDDNPLIIDNQNHQTYCRFFTDDQRISDSLVASGKFNKLELEACFDGFLLEHLGSYDESNTNKKLIRVYDYARVNACDISKIKKDKIVLVIENTQNIYEFRNYLKNKHKLDIDIRVLKNREYFGIFNGISTFLSYAIIFLGGFIIVIFTTNLINSHLDKNSKNIGTLKAFGLSNNLITYIYSSLSFIFIFTGYLLGYLAALAIGFGSATILKNSFNINYANFETPPFIYLCLTLVVLPTVIIFFNLKIRLKNTTPGDLIYARE